MLKALSLYKRLLGASLLLLVFILVLTVPQVKAQSYQPKKCCTNLKVGGRPDGSDCYGEVMQPCTEGKKCPFKLRITASWTNAQCLDDPTAETGCLINAPSMIMVPQFTLQCPMVGVPDCTCDIKQIGNVAAQVLTCNNVGDICPGG